MLVRFDLWPTLLMAISIATILRDRYRIAFAVLGLAILAKAYPILLLPIMITYVARRRGTREALPCALIAIGVCALGIAPFLALDSAATIHGLTRFVERPLQVETLSASLLVIAHNVADVPLKTVNTFGSGNLVGPLPDALALGQSLGLVVVLIAIWIGFARGPSDRARLVVAAAASLTAYVALGKVLSPQYLIWLIPVVAVVGGIRGRIAIVVLAVSLVLTGIEWPAMYYDYVLRFDLGPAIVIFVRNVGLCVLAGILVAGVAARPAGSSVKARPFM
jgi:hypothetical protein